MDPITTAASDQAARKARRLQLGRLENPISGRQVFKKEQQHDFGGKKAVSWVVITPDGKMVKATTYGGDLGKDFNLGDHNTIPVPAAESKDYRKALKGYTAVSQTSDYPAFVVPEAEQGEPNEENTAPADDENENQD